MTLLPLSLIFSIETDPWSLIRVEIPDMPGAVISSATGSVLTQIPTDPDLPWRIEPVPELDEVLAHEAIDAMNVSPWHVEGLDGRGVKVAVFDPQWMNLSLYDHELGEYTTHDCSSHRSCEPAIDPLRVRYSWEQGAHGVACAEVIEDIAPEAELFLVRVNGLTTLENAVDWAIREEIDLVSMSLSFFNESFYDGTGAINAEVERLAEAGILLVTSAGNYADEHWSGSFVDHDDDGLHDFHAIDGGLPIYWGAGTRRLYLSWNQYRLCGHTDLDAYVYNQSGNLVGRSTSTQSSENKNCQPVERVSVQAAEEGWYFLYIDHVSGDPDVRMNVLSRGGTVWQGNAEGSITDPGTHPLALTVGAVRANDYLFNDVEYFSSQGPTLGGLAKPDIAGPDGLSTYTYGPTNFYGTSASTPAVAAAIALEMSAHPGMSARVAADRLMDSAAEFRSTWEPVDMAIGAGRARLPEPASAEPFGCGRGVTVWPILLLPLGRLRPRRRSRTSAQRPSKQVHCEPSD
jgi:hypothetical protein